MRVFAFLLVLPVACASTRPHALCLPVLDGALVKTPDAARVYLVDGGKLRPIGGDAYDRLWRDYERVCAVRGLRTTEAGEPLGTGTRLAQVPGHAHVWLIENGIRKRHISDLPVFERYGFRWDKVERVTLGELEELPTGTPVR